MDTYSLPWGGVTNGIKRMETNTGESVSLSGLNQGYIHVFLFYKDCCFIFVIFLFHSDQVESGADFGLPNLELNLKI